MNEIRRCQNDHHALEFLVPDSIPSDVFNTKAFFFTLILIFCTLLFLSKILIKEYSLKNCLRLIDSKISLCDDLHPIHKVLSHVNCFAVITCGRLGAE